jgi:hypothetical protein
LNDICPGHACPRVRVVSGRQPPFEPGCAECSQRYSRASPGPHHCAGRNHIPLSSTPHRYRPTARAGSHSQRSQLPRPFFAWGACDGIVRPLAWGLHAKMRPGFSARHLDRPAHHDPQQALYRWRNSPSWGINLKDVPPSYRDTLGDPGQNTAHIP